MFFCTALISPCPRAQLPQFDHVVVAIEENHGYSDIIGNSAAPYINALANQGALFTNSFAIEHPSQPNYLDLFSGSNQGVTDDSTPWSFSTPNLGAELIAKGLSFGGYSESMPSVGYTGDNFSNVVGQNQYMRKHNPWVNWQGAASNGIPATDNLPLTNFPSDFSQLPTVSFVVPNEQNDMHDGTIQTANGWLQTHLDAYVQWAKTHNSLFILTWDEDDYGGQNQVATIFAGANVRLGQYNELINHYNVLRTAEDFYGLSHAGNSATATTITDVFDVPEPSGSELFAMVGAGLVFLKKAQQRARKFL